MPLQHFSSGKAICISALGDVARCAHPRHYWKHGFFNGTDCAFEDVVSITCHDATSMADSDACTQVCKLGAGEYFWFTDTAHPHGTCILPRSLSEVDVSGTGACTLPWLGNPRGVRVDECARMGNWSGLSLEYVELPWVKSLTQLVEIDLSSNLLSEIPDLSLPLLTRMDLQSNRLTAFESHARIRYDVKRNPKIDHATLRYDRGRMLESLREIGDPGVLFIVSPISVPLSEVLNPNLAGLLAYNVNLSGTIPASIGTLKKKLQVFEIGRNRNVRRTIPESFWHLTNLQRVSISTTSISGTISPLIGNLRQLKILELQDSELSGTIPSSLANLTKLKKLGLPIRKS